MYLPAKYRLQLYFKEIREIFYRLEKNQISKFKTYFAKSVDNEIIKIGKSMNPLKRVEELKNSLKYNWNIEKDGFNLMGVLEYDIEASLHNLLRGYNIKGEWYPNTLFINDTLNYIFNNNKKFR